MMKRVLVACGLIVAAALPADARQLKLQIADGHVTLDAQAVSARQILTEWARIGGTKVVGGDKLPGAPLTLRLVNMPERQALDIILRSAAGFMAAPRQASSISGASTYDRILILATTSATAAGAPGTSRTAVPPPTGNVRPGMPFDNGAMISGRRPPPRPPNLPPTPADDEAEEDEEEAEEDEQADNGVTQPVFTFPAPTGSSAPGNPVFVPVPNGNPAFAAPGTPGAVTTPVITLQPGANGQPTIYNFVPTADGAPTTAPPPSSTPTFGVIGAPTPGMVQPAQQTPATTTRPPTRPPGQ